MSDRIRKTRLIFRLLMLVTALNLGVACIIWSLMYFVWPDSYFTWFPAIPLFFWLVALGMAISLELTHTEKANAVTMTYMIVRGVKLLLTAVFVGCYAWLVHTDVRQFGLTTLAFYIVYLVLETYIFYLYEKRRNKRSIEKENNEV
jgi:small-conductance mechanosensitive channel